MKLWVHVSHQKCLAVGLLGVLSVLAGQHVSPVVAIAAVLFQCDAILGRYLCVLGPILGPPHIIIYRIVYVPSVGYPPGGTQITVELGTVVDTEFGYGLHQELAGSALQMWNLHPRGVERGYGIGVLVFLLFPGGSRRGQVITATGCEQENWEKEQEDSFHVVYILLIIIGIGCNG